MKNVSVFLLVLLLTLVTACGGQDTVRIAESTPAPSVPEPLTVEWKCTTPDQPWQDKETIQLLYGTAADTDMSINTYVLGQNIIGFGGCFNEKGWVALSVLPPEEREAVLRELFDPEEGAKFHLCRVPIGASDFAVSRYTLDETEGDYEMQDFSIDRDRENLIPYIKAAMEYRPDLRVWGSAWTPPSWMKTNDAYDGGHMKDDPQVYQAYALYLARFVEAYQAEGIDLFAVAVQNEPAVETKYPSCLWEPEQFGTFIKDYMGPLFVERPVHASIMLGTLNEGRFWSYPSLLTNSDVSQYVSIVGYQWDGINAVLQTRVKFPDMAIYQTETECGNCHWKDGFNPDRPPNDWAYGVYTWHKVKQYFDAGVNTYCLWNMILDTEGKNIDAELPWPQNAAITIGKDTGKITYTPMFYAFKHFSYYIEPGAHYLNTDGGDNAVAFLNPDGSLIIELQNADEEPRTVTLNIDGGTMTVEIPGMSWNTLIVPKH